MSPLLTLISWICVLALILICARIFLVAFREARTYAADEKRRLALYEPPPDTTAFPDDPWPYVQRRRFISPIELGFYWKLVSALPECLVMCQVQLFRIIDVGPHSERRIWVNRIAQLSIDYVICLPDGTVVACIELDDPSHDRADRKRNDEKKSRSLRAAGVPLIRWDVRQMPTSEQIRQAFITPELEPVIHGMVQRQYEAVRP